jgi:hypothetical protein
MNAVNREEVGHPSMEMGGESLIEGYLPPSVRIARE